MVERELMNKFGGHDRKGGKSSEREEKEREGGDEENDGEKEGE